jgi:hypothetical protein
MCIFVLLFHVILFLQFNSLLGDSILLIFYIILQSTAPLISDIGSYIRICKNIQFES